jgi:hypothetical protein
MAQGTSSGTSSRRHGRNEHDTSSISSSRYADAEWEAKEVTIIFLSIMACGQYLVIKTSRRRKHLCSLANTWISQTSVCSHFPVITIYLSPFPSCHPVLKYYEFRDVTPWSLVGGYQRFRGTCCPHFKGRRSQFNICTGHIAVSGILPRFFVYHKLLALLCQLW